MQVPIIVFRLDCEPGQGRVSPPCRPPSPSPPGAPGQYCRLRHLLLGAALCPSIIPLPSHLEEKDNKILSSGNRQRCQRRLQGEERKSSDATMLLVRHSSFYSHHHGHHHSFMSEFFVIDNPISSDFAAYSSGPKEGPTVALLVIGTLLSTMFSTMVTIKQGLAIVHLSAIGFHCWL